MTRTPVQSGSIASAGHDGHALEVEFKNGGVYRYAGVPKSAYDEMLAADSVGRYFHGNIRGKFDSVKVTEDGNATTESVAQ